MATTTATSADQVVSLFLQDINAPDTPGNHAAVKIWLAHENGDPTLRNNPWNLHSPGGLPGQVGSDYVSASDKDVAVFGTIQQGVAANANNMINAGYYTAPLNALRSNNPVGFLQGIAASPWAGSHYEAQTSSGSYIPGTNTLINDWNKLMGGSASPTSSGTDPTGGLQPNNAWTNVLTDTLNLSSGKNWIDLLNSSAFFGGVVGSKSSNGGTTYTSSNADTKSVLGALAALNINPNSPVTTTDAQKVEAYLNAHGASSGITGAGGAFSQLPNLGPNLPNVSGINQSGAANPDTPNQGSSLIDLGPLDSTIIQIATYLIAAIVIIFGIYLYSKGDRQKIQLVKPSAA